MNCTLDIFFDKYFKIGLYLNDEAISKFTKILYFYISLQFVNKDHMDTEFDP